MICKSISIDIPLWRCRVDKNTCLKSLIIFWVREFCSRKFKWQRRGKGISTRYVLRYRSSTILCYLQSKLWHNRISFCLVYKRHKLFSDLSLHFIWPIIWDCFSFLLVSTISRSHSMEILRVHHILQYYCSASRTFSLDISKCFTCVYLMGFIFRG